MRMLSRFLVTVLVAVGPLAWAAEGGSSLLAVTPAAEDAVVITTPQTAIPEVATPEEAALVEKFIAQHAGQMFLGRAALQRGLEAMPIADGEGRIPILLQLVLKDGRVAKIGRTYFQIQMKRAPRSVPENGKIRHKHFHDTNGSVY